MLPPKNRANRKLLIKILKEGKSFFSTNVFLKTIPISQNNPVFAFVVPAKTLKKATERNKLKRRARYIVKTTLKEIKKGLGVVLFFKKGIKNKSFYEIKEEVTQLFKKGGILLKMTANKKS